MPGIYNLIVQHMGLRLHLKAIKQSLVINIGSIKTQTGHAFLFSG